MCDLGQRICVYMSCVHVRVWRRCSWAVWEQMDTVASVVGWNEWTPFYAINHHVVHIGSYRVNHVLEYITHMNMLAMNITRIIQHAHHVPLMLVSRPSTTTSPTGHLYPSWFTRSRSCPVRTGVLVQPRVS